MELIRSAGLFTPPANLLTAARETSPASHSLPLHPSSSTPTRTMELRDKWMHRGILILSAFYFDGHEMYPLVEFSYSGKISDFEMKIE